MVALVRSVRPCRVARRLLVLCLVACCGAVLIAVIRAGG
jgi:hypothetical protein